MAFRAKVLLLNAILPFCLRADDGAASIAAGGIVVMMREPRIAMAKEVLQISTTKVIVDYDFRNDSDEDITTVVAFPIPDYDHDLSREGRLSKSGFEDFRLWVDGAVTAYRVEARAFLGNTEYTDLLTGMHVDVASFGHARFGPSPEVQRLTSAEQRRLENSGLVDPDGGEPLWVVKKKYYWQQTFPAHKTVHIRHAYTPILGTENSIKHGMRPDPDLHSNEELKSFCIDGRLRTILQEIADGKDKDAPYTYVDFILTTANTWKTPIEDFTLIVERPHWKNRGGESDLADYISFCWDGPVTKLDGDHFSAHAANFVPTKELRIGFFRVIPTNR
jgi:hypothetical protein